MDMIEITKPNCVSYINYNEGGKVKIWEFQEIEEQILFPQSDQRFWSEIYNFWLWGFETVNFVPFFSP